MDVQNRLLQLSGTQVVDPTPAETGAAPLESQVNVSAAMSNVDCFGQSLLLKLISLVVGPPQSMLCMIRDRIRC